MNERDEGYHYEEDDGPAEGSTCILACAFGVVMFFVLIGVALWMVNK